MQGSCKPPFIADYLLPGVAQLSITLVTVQRAMGTAVEAAVRIFAATTATNLATSPMSVPLRHEGGH